MKTLSIPSALLGLAAFFLSSLTAQDRPNIFWFTAEDMSPTLGCYGDPYAVSPNIDKFASESVRYTNAFATSPVCSPARSTLITGVYSTSMGTQRLRSEFPIPDRVKGWPSYLRELGYYTTNNVKTDYNTAAHDRLIQESWDESSATAHWRGRKEGQNFFHIFNDMDSHQSRSMVWPYEEFVTNIQSQLSPEKVHDADTAPMWPYYPDTEVTRRTLARYYDCVSVMDQHFGEFLKQLEEDGLAENTIVFFYSDHGSGMPRHKRNLQDTGLKVPLLIRFPEKWQHLAPAQPGETVDRLVSFVDFAPSVLSLLDQPIPDYMQGTPFLGAKEGEPRQYVYGARDRVDEAYDVGRSVRDDRWLYIRNFMPHISYNQPSAYSDLGEIRDEITEMAAAGKLAEGPQMNYAGPRKPVEELYDTSNDPLCLVNLAIKTEHADKLEELRAAQSEWSWETRDMGFLPEDVAMNLAQKQPLLDLPEDYPLTEIRAAAELVGANASHTDEMIACFASPNPAVRYWGVVALHNLGEDAVPAHKAVEGLLSDPVASVRIEAASTLASLGQPQLALEQLLKELETEDLAAKLMAVRTIEMMGEEAKEAVPQMKEISQHAVGAKGDYNMFMGFSADAFLAKVVGD